MNTDFAFTIGSTHEVCQDYATNFGKHSDHHVIVCDGCSSSPMTDVGARLLALTASYVLSTSGLSADFYNIVHTIVQLIKSKYAHELLMNPFMFDATLLIAQEYKNRFNHLIRALMYGDGMIVAKHHLSDEVTVINSNYKLGHPEYLSYKFDQGREENYKALQEMCDSDIFTCRLIDTHLHVPQTISTHPSGASYVYSFPVNEYDWITIMSDGICSFYEKESRQPISQYRVIQELLNFKMYQGKFVQRRLNAFKKKCIELGWEHYDDLSIATIYTGE